MMDETDVDFLALADLVDRLHGAADAPGVSAPMRRFAHNLALTADGLLHLTAELDRRVEALERGQPSTRR